MTEPEIVVQVEYCNAQHLPHPADPVTIINPFGGKILLFRRDIPFLISKLLVALFTKEYLP